MPPSKDWIVRLKPSPSARTRLFCFPCGGVGVSPYKQWPQDLGPGFDVCALQPPGREGRRTEGFITQMAPFLAAVHDAVRPLLDRPFAFFGHSLGSLVAFELTRRLRREGAPLPIHLFVSGRHAPQWPLGARDHTLPEAEFLEVVRKLNGLPREVLENAELMDVMLPILRADCELHESYEHAVEPPLDVPISAFSGKDDPTAVDEQLRAWGAQTSKAFLLRILPGDHFYLHTHRAALLTAITGDLAATARA